MWYKVNKIYVGTQQVRPWIQKIECDFTTWDHWFTWYWWTSYTLSYGRESSHWLYLYARGYCAWAWSIPQSIYSKWDIKKIELDLYSTIALEWWWTNLNTEWAWIRVWINMVQWDGATTVWNTPAWWFKFTIDLENKQATLSYTNTIVQLDDTWISSYKTWWSSWTLHLTALHGANWTYWYAFIEKATFYIQ